MTDAERREILEAASAALLHAVQETARDVGQQLGEAIETLAGQLNTYRRERDAAKSWALTLINSTVVPDGVDEVEGGEHGRNGTG